MHRSALAGLLALMFLLGACSDDADTDDAAPADDAESTTDSETNDTEPDDTETDDPAVDDTGTDEAASETDEAASEDTEVPAEDAGTITIDGQPFEVGAADFLICETVNPAFADDVNVIVALPDVPEVSVTGVLPDGVDGIYGRFPDDVYVEDIDAVRDGRTLSGSFDAEGTAVEFSFTC